MAQLIPQAHHVIPLREDGQRNPNGFRWNVDRLIRLK
jgi:hypothetical protein